MATSPDGVCRGHAYPGYFEDRELLNSIYNYTEVPVSLVGLILTSLIIIISIYGKIDGTFKWCVLNIAMLHLLWPLTLDESSFAYSEFDFEHWNSRLNNGYMWVTTSGLESIPFNASKPFL
uniref:Uncharacterized protein n=1 Tax=Acrobeloides nanus TaxID=290746 RepID=A0A914EPH4_9BILA